MIEYVAYVCLLLAGAIPTCIEFKKLVLSQYNDELITSLKLAMRCEQVQSVKSIRSAYDGCLSPQLLEEVDNWLSLRE